MPRQMFDIVMIFFPLQYIPQICQKDYHWALFLVDF